MKTLTVTDYTDSPTGAMIGMVRELLTTYMLDGLPNDSRCQMGGESYVAHAREYDGHLHIVISISKEEGKQ